MKPRVLQSKFTQFSSPHLCRALAILWLASLGSSVSVALGQEPPNPATAANTTEADWKIPNDQLDSLVAPIALYPDPLLSQTLVASTYPLEIIQLQQWMERNKTLQGKALADAVQKQKWDPSIQSMVAVPDVIQRMAGNIQWTTELGNAFLAQPADVMDAVQRMRAKAQRTKALESNAQQKVETQVVEGGKQVIIIQQANPQVIYIPSYDPVVVYGAPIYPYPSYIYRGYAPGTGLAFGLGIAMGAAWGGGWGYNCGWGGNNYGNINVNINNNYIHNSNRINYINNGKWQHQVAHRGGTPYGRGGIGGIGGGTRPGGIGGIGGVGNRPGGVGGIGGAGNRPGNPGGIGGAGNKPGNPGNPGGIGGIGGAGNRPGNPGNPGGIGGAGNKPGNPGNKPGGVGGAGNRPSTLPASRPNSGNKVGSRNVSPGSGYGSNKSAFGGSGSSGSAARSSSSRGSSSMRSSSSSRSGGGASRGGGGSRGGSRRR